MDEVNLTKLLLHAEMMGVVYETDPIKTMVSYSEQHFEGSPGIMSAVSNVEGWDPMTRALASVEILNSFATAKDNGSHTNLFGYSEKEWREDIHAYNNAEVPPELYALFAFELEKRIAQKAAILTNGPSGANSSEIAVWTAKAAKRSRLLASLNEVDLELCVELEEYLRDSLALLAELDDSITTSKIAAFSRSRNVTATYYTTMLSALGKKLEYMRSQMESQIFTGESLARLRWLREVKENEIHQYQSELERQRALITTFQSAGLGFLGLVEEYTETMKEIARTREDIQRIDQ
ncbi:hypothetical protein HDU97_006043 [Phlyctochytrium planicorne]|nr:hypothetical protein HDU97_006043 [Phlyctochytrium planicorne]